MNIKAFIYLFFVIFSFSPLQAMQKNYSDEDSKESHYTPLKAHHISQEKMETPREKIIEELRTITTSNQWSLLDKVLTKLNKKLPEPITARELGTFLQEIPDKELDRYGIWVHAFGPKYAPIICINPAFGRANDSSGLNRPCKCKITSSTPTHFFSSHNYNVGRHESTSSSHIATCSKWYLPTAGHLHSWRRGYD